jgi:hypothetical protein
MVDPILLNAKQISEVLGIGVREIRYYVEEYKLPAFQERPGGKWKARRESLNVWAEEHEKKYLNWVCQ